MKLRDIRIVGLLIPLALGLVAYGETAMSAPTATSAIQSLPILPKNSFGFSDLKVEQLANGITRKDFTLINVHVPDGVRLPKTDLSIPFDQIASNLNKLPNKNAPIVVYCRSGGMSSQAAAALAAAGYTRIYELDGGFNAWKAAGHGLLGK